jgi:hypothetical protein
MAFGRGGLQPGKQLELAAPGSKSNPVLASVTLEGLPSREAHAVHDPNARISLKNALLRRPRCVSAAPVREAKLGCCASCGEDRRRKGMRFASFLRFWAVAANRNSSLGGIARDLSALAMAIGSNPLSSTRKS